MKRIRFDIRHRHLTQVFLHIRGLKNILYKFQLRLHFCYKLYIPGSNMVYSYLKHLILIHHCIYNQIGMLSLLLKMHLHRMLQQVYHISAQQDQELFDHNNNQLGNLRMRQLYLQCMILLSSQLSILCILPLQDQVQRYIKSMNNLYNIEMLPTLQSRDIILLLLL